MVSVALEPQGGPCSGGTRGRVRVEGVMERWSLHETQLVLVFCTRLRRMPVKARLEACEGDYATCSFTTPSWGRQEFVRSALP